MAESLTAISYGGGVQSTAMLVLANQGKLGYDVDVAVFANVGERSEHPDTLTYVREWATKKSAIPVVEIERRNRAGEKVDLRAQLERPDYRYVEIPVYLRGGGPAKRACTGHWKIEPIGKFLKSRGASEENPATVCIGISTDEIQRMKDAPEKWCNNRWPLIEKRMSRWHCLRWMRDNGYNELPQKSACTFCPYHDNAFWREMKATDQKSWAQAVQVDEHIRDNFRGTTSKIYIHRSFVPLKDADLSDPAEDQITMDFGDECDGMCGV